MQSGARTPRRRESSAVPSTRTRRLTRRPRCLLLMAQELDFTDITGVVFGDDEVAIVVHRDLTDLADFWRGGIVEPGAVAIVGEKISVEEEVDVTVRVEIPYLAPIIGREE